MSKWIAFLWIVKVSYLYLMVTLLLWSSSYLFLKIWVQSLDSWVYALLQIIESRNKFLQLIKLLLFSIILNAMVILYARGYQFNLKLFSFVLISRIFFNNRGLDLIRFFITTIIWMLRIGFVAINYSSRCFFRGCNMIFGNMHFILLWWKIWRHWIKFDDFLFRKHNDRSWFFWGLDWNVKLTRKNVTELICLEIVTAGLGIWCSFIKFRYGRAFSNFKKTILNFLRVEEILPRYWLLFKLNFITRIVGRWYRWVVFCWGKRLIFYLIWRSFFRNILRVWVGVNLETGLIISS